MEREKKSHWCIFLVIALFLIFGVLVFAGYDLGERQKITSIEVKK